MIRVLLVEDDPTARLFVTAFFQDVKDIEVVDCASDGYAGLQAIATYRPHVVLLDLVMPSLTGVGLLQELELCEGERPVVLVLSCVNTPQMVRYVVEQGATFYLLKPVNLGELPALIRRLCAQRLAPKGVQGMLVAMGGRTSHAGFHNACAAAQFLAQSPEGEPLKAAYYHAAKEGQTTMQCVEKNIRLFVGRLMEGNTSSWQALWEETPERRPTNGVFLRQVARKLREME